LPLRGLSLVLLIVAILLCLLGIDLGFVAFMILALAFEVIDVLCGLKRQWKAGYRTSGGG